MKSQNWLWGLGLAAVLTIGAAGLWVLTQSYTFHGSVIEKPMPAPNFTLIQANGNPFQLSDYKGQIVVLFFGYTSCPDVCPTTLSELRKMRARLPRETNHVQVVFVSVDPDRDTPERVASYVSAFDSSFIGLSGKLDSLTPIWKAYGVYVEKHQSDSAMGYEVDHTAVVYVIDKDGNLRVTYPFGETADDMVQDVNYLISETHAAAR